MSILLRWLSLRSLRLLHALGGVAGWAAYLLSPSYRARLRAHAALAGISVAQRRAAVAQAGRLVLELPRLWLRPPGQTIPDPVRWQGAERVESLLDEGRGLILLTPHLGSFEIAAQAYAERFGARQPVTVLYRPARQRWLRELEAVARARPARWPAWRGCGRWCARCAAARRWACCPTRYRPKAWACGRRFSAGRPTP